MADLYNTRSGDDRGHVAGALAQKRVLTKRIGETLTHDIAIVHYYNFEEQLVDARLKFDPAGPIYSRLPIVSGGHVRALKSITQHGASVASVGRIVFPRMASPGAFNDRSSHHARFSGQPFKGIGAFFVPESAFFKNETMPTVMDAAADGSNLDKLGPADEAFLFAPGTAEEGFIMRKSTGDLVIKTPPGKNVFVGTTDKLIGSGHFKKLAKDGDTVSGSTIIATSNVYGV